MENTHKLLLEMLLRPAMGQPSGIRVYEDGLYRYTQANSGWYDVWRFSPEEMHVLRQAIATADIPVLNSHYESQSRVSDGTTTLWQITVDGQPYAITLSPGAHVPALDNLYHTFSTLRKLTPERSHWRVRLSDGTYHEFSVMGSVNAVEALRPLITAMFVPQAANDGDEIDFAPEDLLIRTDWVMEEKTEQTSLYGDGRYVRDVEGKAQVVKVLPLEQVHNVARSIAAIDWSKIPAQIDAN